MHIKSILAGAALALALTAGTASAANQFTSLEGIQAVPMNAAEMDQVRGAGVDLSALESRSALTTTFTDRLDTLSNGVCLGFCAVTPTPAAGP